MKLPRKPGKALVYSSYHTACRYELWKAGRRARGRVPVLVYQMGKVGSCSVVHSLEKGAPGVFPVHLHYLTDRRIQAVEQDNRSTFARRRRLSSHLVGSLYVRARLARGGFPGGVKVVTLTREPVSRAVSAFFHFMEFTFPDFELEARLARQTPQELASDLMPYFWKRFEQDRHRPEAWLESELKGVLGFDVFQHPFPREQGYAVYGQEGGPSVLVIKLEHLDRVASAAMRDFLGLQEFRLLSSNEAKDKRYYAAYRAFQHALALSPQVLDEVYGSRYVRHFYSDDEIVGFRQRWQAVPCAA